MLILLGVPYNSNEAITLAEDVMKFIQFEGRKKSGELAEERGLFPNYNGSIYDKPDGVPMRNATVTTIAPTGTISIISGCSSGVEPLFAVSYVRNVMDGQELVETHPVFESIAKENEKEQIFQSSLLRGKTSFCKLSVAKWDFYALLYVGLFPLFLYGRFSCL